MDRRKDNDFRLKKATFRLDISKTFFAVRLVGHWMRLSRENVGALSLEDVQSQVGWGSEQPGLAKGVPAHCRGFG